MLICKRCKKELPPEAYESPRKTCRECRKAYFKNRYKNNEDRRSAVKQWVKTRVAENGKKVWDYLKEHPCGCGESDPVALEFDHVRGKKKASVSFLVTHSATWETIKEEIEKCNILCANCHRKKTAKQLGWYKYL